MIGGCATIASATLALAGPPPARQSDVGSTAGAVDVTHIEPCLPVAIRDATAQASTLERADHAHARVWLAVQDAATGARPRVASEAAFNLLALTSGLLMALRTMLSELGSGRAPLPRDDSATARLDAVSRRRATAVVGRERVAYSAVAADAAGGATGGCDRRLKAARGECDHDRDG